MKDSATQKREKSVSPISHTSQVRQQSERRAEAPEETKEQASSTTAKKNR
jgi:hypothetical protein